MKILAILLFFTSCASYVQRMHHQIKKDEKLSRSRTSQGRQPPSTFNNRQKKFYDPYNGYRGIPVDKRDARPIENPLTLGGPQISNSSGLKRKYNKRYTAEDLKDNGDGASLWSGDNSESYLFVNNSMKRNGDVVIVEVSNKLKENITAELKRAFPERRKPTPSEDTKDKKEEDTTDKVAEDKKPASGDSKKVYDKISTLVIDSVNKDYLMIRGRKEVLFKEKKRYIELSALVSRKNIKENDTVNSLNLLEPKVVALRYKK